MVYTRRFYEDLLEPISKQKFSKRYNLIKLMCKKIKNTNNIMINNPYFLKEIANNRRIKRIFNKLLLFCLNKELNLILTILINKKIYYKLVHIKYVDNIYFKASKGE